MRRAASLVQRVHKATHARTHVSKAAAHLRDREKSPPNSARSSYLFFGIDNLDVPCTLSAYNLFSHTTEQLDLPEKCYYDVKVEATEKDLGLVCILRGWIGVLVGNPLLGSWNSIPLPFNMHSSGQLAGLALRHKLNNFFAYRLFAFFLEENKTTLSVNVFDAESGFWTNKVFRSSVSPDTCFLYTMRNDPSILFTADGSKAYINFGSGVSIATYDMDKDELAVVTPEARIEKPDWDCSNEDWYGTGRTQIAPTLVVCQGDLYVIGKIHCKSLLGVWKLVSNVMVFESEYVYESRDRTTLFASDGKYKIYVRSPEYVIEYDVERKEWSRFASPMSGFGCSSRLGIKMFSGTLLVPSKPHVVKDLKVEKQIFCVPKPPHKEADVWLFKRDSTVRAILSPMHGCMKAVAVLKDMDLICLISIFSGFPEKICVCNSATGWWEEVGIALSQEMSVKPRTLNGRHDPLAYEFIGVNLKKQQQTGYYLYYFYLETGKMAEDSKVHVLRYDSVMRSWDEPSPEPCRVDPQTYGWTCAIAGGNSSCKDKIYLSNIRFYRRSFGEPRLSDQDVKKHMRCRNKMRAIAYDSVNNVWDDAVLPRAGVTAPCEPDAFHDEADSGAKCNIVVCGGKLFVVGRCHDSDDETVGIWLLMEGGVTEAETTVGARGWGFGSRTKLWFGTDGINKIFVTVVEKDYDNSETNWVMEYDLENKQWTRYPFKHDIESFIAE